MQVRKNYGGVNNALIQMDPEEFEDGPGQINPYNGLPCYEPSGLPPEIEYTDDILRSYGDARYALGQLSTLHHDLDNENLLIAPFVVREAAMSSQIEGTDVTVSDIILHAPADDPEHSAAELRDIREAYNYVEAISTAFDALEKGESITRSLSCELHEHLLVDVRGEEKRPGEVRDVPVIIGPDSNPEHARFIPSNPETAPLLLDNLLTYIQTGKYPPLIDTAISHYQFETIHPFRDGNGRLGRLLIMLQLHQADLLPEPYLYLSAYFNQHRLEYFDRLLAVSKHGAWEEWIVFVLEGVTQQAIDAYERGRELIALRDEYRSNYPNSPAVRDLVDFLFEEPYVKASRAIEKTGRSNEGIYGAIERLEDDGVLEEITGKDYNRVYRAAQILSIVESR